MQMAALQYLNISGEYKAYEIKENELEKVFEELKNSGIRGFNVTIPYKTKIIPLIDTLSERAKLVGAINTVTFDKDKKSIGDNTDVIGFWDAIPEEIRKKLKGQNISILGYGGSARAACVALISNGVKNIKVYGRNKEKLEEFKKHFNLIEIDLLVNINLSNTFMLVNATPIGMFPNVDDSPVLKVELKKLPEEAIVYDIIYNPPETQLLKYASSLKKKTLNGIEMLIRQGAASLGIWLSQEVAPLGAMKLAVMQSVETLHATSLQQ